MERAKVLVELAKLAASRHDQRRNYEWKVSLALWAVLVGAVVKPIPISKMPWWVGLLVGCLYAVFWLRAVWVANYNDKARSEFLFNEALACLRDSDRVSGNPPGKLVPSDCKYWFGFLCDWAMLFHLFTTAILIALAVWTTWVGGAQTLTD